MSYFIYIQFTCSNSSNGKGEVGTRCSLGDVEMVFAKHTEDKSTQTCFQFTSEFDSISMDHTYAFSFGDIIDIKESRQSIQEQLEVKEEMLINLKKKVGQLQKEINNGNLLFKSLRMTTLQLNFTQVFPITKPYWHSMITSNQK